MISTAVNRSTTQTNQELDCSSNLSTEQVRNLAIAEDIYSAHENSTFELLNSKERELVRFGETLPVSSSKLVFHQSEVESELVLAKARGESAKTDCTVTPVIKVTNDERELFFLISDGNHSIISDLISTPITEERAFNVHIQDDEALRSFWGGEEIDQSILELNKNKGVLPQLVTKFAEEVLS